MSRVGGITGGTPPLRRAVRTGAGFALPDSAAAREGAATAAAGSVSALLALQEQGAPVEPPGERAARRGNAALDELNGLQLDLLRGRDDPERLERLAALAGGAEAVADPMLRRTLQEISLRARVELARRRVAFASGR
ncbi:flagellar assembly protein FliX [Falsiroseomonas sp.]|uniref:flagellar assembly protein FliX n=1 Tax=Falsiroseomonas sp. TaxID=2870721 RepID=UPI0035648470